MRSTHWVVPRHGSVVDTTRNPNHPTLRAVCSACGKPVIYVDRVDGYRRPTWRHQQEVH